ncbi:MAG TPA: hypothetical protein VM802_21815 [Chitinophaga sp.]|uniref:DUF6929 family protein n=1 Tax=Chitinophaga sp. TaxID=1869181 RepID=UPI002B707DE5|nr:hypothetical protein [Chitinophaga sp.]HVI47523.1 hypothetical protein [Chitinophaga sp.]
MNAWISLLRTLPLPDFPSGSSISFHQGCLYLVGDDANNILVLDTQYHPLRTISLFDYPGKRIPKALKPDLETSVIMQKDGHCFLLVLGSASTVNRTRVIRVVLPGEGETHDFARFSSSSYSEDFFRRLENYGITTPNIEAAAVINDQLVLGNRGHNNRQENELIVTSSLLAEDDKDDQLHIFRIIIPASDINFPGISELCYAPEQDLLLATFSSENTSNTYDDGEIGDSYIGWITNAAGKLTAPEIQLDGLLNLSTSDNTFKGQKIEGLCIESVSGNEYNIHLVADDDLGSTMLFKIKFVLTV